MKLERSGCLMGDHLDIREPGSSPLTWWVEAMMRISPRVEQYLGLIGVAHGQWFDYPQFNRSFPNDEYFVDTRNQTIVWSSLKCPFNGSVALVLKHTHRL